MKLFKKSLFQKRYRISASKYAAQNLRIRFGQVCIEFIIDEHTWL